jgi:uncharacterized protein (TIGR00299 family) protein
MHLHLDPVGGVAGDMFVGALLDAWPELEAPLQAALTEAGLTRLMTARRSAYRDHTLSGSHFEVEPVGADNLEHRSFRAIRDLLSEVKLGTGAKQQALAIFQLLAEAEGKVHGIASEQVLFHELGAWDSIADIVSAAWLIDRLAVEHWSCAPLPMGRGRVASAHGWLPVPTPATTLLLESFPLLQDDLDGERITPTGAAILRHLAPSFEPLRMPQRLQRSGIGFGSKTFTGISNVLRVLVFESTPHTMLNDQVALCQFELDDQTAEDLAVALERLRAMPAVLDVIQAAVFGKKGRLATQVQVLAKPEALESVLASCFVETSTLGIRWQVVQRAVLERETITREIATGRPLRVKQARRPGGGLSRKAEMDDLAGASVGRAGREALRRQVEQDEAQENDNE